jgi:ABC-type bacteriocin/lantibiotic exporter with double-glycine peptidase domain
MFIGTRSFSRSLQLDDYSCGSRAIYSVMRHFGVTRPHWLLKSQLNTSPDAGTAVHRMIRVLRRHRLKVGYRPNLNWRGLVQALKADVVVIVHLDGDHIAVAHAVTEHHVLLADPSVLRCPGRRQTRRRFLERWSRWGLIVARAGARND